MPAACRCPGAIRNAQKMGGDMDQFSGKAVLISGGARGIGRAVAFLFARRGAKVVIGDVLADEAGATVAALRAEGLSARCVPLDVSSAPAWSNAVRETVDWGGGVHVLVNNAGILVRKHIETYSEDEWRRVLDVNLTGSFLGIRAVVPHMRGSGGAIVNIASNAAFSGHPDPAYSASKWGLRGLTRSAALQFAADGIRVNCVCPGLVSTDIIRGGRHVETMVGMTPLGRMADADDIASAVGYLAGDAARMITGEEIIIDGGFTSGAAYWKTAVDADSYR
ncbi:SDR family NAD(P)-dependent oxidoreductase [Azospirillum canadense]|uniref:SDR family NAD(P)-dependent oxidoreductase n=1 Tax=Azospirillum canadense TaxID=403962 RepID=UPI002226A13B|nr:SDR family NAD(P)-dependent oxidoreductase [Azospirillum canadense]MCW2241828.1 3alpha(or 20beta)-hydroxysteroid dehydrogenase [Azospirillum canadense]